VQAPDQDDSEKLKRIIRYLKASRDLTLDLQPDEGMTIRVYIDASHGVHVDMKGHTGATIALGAGSLMAKSSKQRLTAKSSTESELIACSDFLSVVIMVRDLMIEMGYPMGPAEVLQDNVSTLKLIERGRPASDRTRHVAIRFFFIKDRADAGEVRLEYCPTEEMLADVLTKPMQGAKFFKFRDKLLNTAGRSNGRGVLEVQELSTPLNDQKE
jgi:hypothetical protein